MNIVEQLERYYIIKPINTIEYETRLSDEIKILIELDYLWFIKRLVEIYNEHIKIYPNLLRGSAGSSLLLYYLGINQIDPIKYSISLTRFVNKLRNTSPDIDIDVPSSIRNNLMDTIIDNNVDTMRITSNYNDESNIYFDNLIREDPSVSVLHNSAIIIYSRKQQDVIEKTKLTHIQLGLTKNNIEEEGLKKIDVLANTALEQLYFIDNAKKIYDYNFYDPDVYKFMIDDDGIGITFAETPMVQHIIKILKPTNIEQLSICISIVRPFACDNICDNITWDKLKYEIIYDDDFINFLNVKLKIDEDEADNIRRLFKKKSDSNKMNEFIQRIDDSDLEINDKIKLKRILFKLSKYSFCKAHSINYARMIYCLYWNKFFNSKKFWISTIKTIKGYYKDWVYIRKGLEYGLKFKGVENCNPFYHYVYTGFWLGKEFMSRCYLKINSIVEQVSCLDENVHRIKYNQECQFRGLIAGIGNMTTKYHKYQMIITLGYDNNKFINLHLNKKRDLSKFKQISGKGYFIEAKVPYIVITKMTLF
jgi:DNA polymerase III alpha subunit